jgi:hypothetical protein
MIRLKGESGAAFRGNVAERMPPGALDTLRVGASSGARDVQLGAADAPDEAVIIGRDRVRVKVRPNVK